jgi:hypothetical protein
LEVIFATINRWEKRRAQPSPLTPKKIEAAAHDLGEVGLPQQYFGGKS